MEYFDGLDPDEARIEEFLEDIRNDVNRFLARMEKRFSRFLKRK